MSRVQNLTLPSVHTLTQYYNNNNSTLLCGAVTGVVWCCFRYERSFNLRAHLWTPNFNPTAIQKRHTWYMLSSLEGASELACYHAKAISGVRHLLCRIPNFGQFGTFKNWLGILHGIGKCQSEISKLRLTSVSEKEAAGGREWGYESSQPNL